MYKKSAEVIVSWDTSPIKWGGLTTDEGLKVRMGRAIKELIKAEKKTNNRGPKHVRELLT